MRPRLHLALLALAAVAALGVARPAAAQMQIPQRFENLEVLPKDIPRDTLIQVMRSFATSLGVRCTYCHVAVESAGAERIDWKRDDKPTKDKARAMMRMVGSINGELLPKVPDRRTPPVNVTCATCHRTLPVPLSLAQVLDSAATAPGARGADSAIALYRRLRANEASNGRWDFSEGTLSDLARQLAARGRGADAIALLELNAEQYPNSAGIDVQLAEVWRAQGDRDKAIARYRMALTKQPRNENARRRLAELEAAKP